MKHLGSALLVVGTTVGAGMLSLPLVTAACGFFTTIVLLLLSWSVMYLTSLKLLNVCSRYKKGVNYSTIIEKQFSPVLQMFFTVFYLLLLYALMAAYTTQGASFTASLMPKQAHMALSGIVFLIIFGLIILNIKLSDYANRLFLLLKFVLFALAIIAMLAYLQSSNLLVTPSSFYALVYAWPTLLPAFGFQNIIPVLYEYQQGDVRAVKKSILAGSLLVLFIYLIWVFCCLAILPQQGKLSYSNIFIHGNALPEFISTLSAYTHSHFIRHSLFGFINVSIMTSFICTGLSLVHYIRDIFRRLHVKTTLFVCLILALVPPYIFTLFYPQGFILALQYASIFAVLIFVYTPIYLGKSSKTVGINYYAVILGSLVIIAQIYNLYGHGVLYK